MEKVNKRIILIQPPLLHSNMDVDIIQKKYWAELRNKVSEILKRIDAGKHLTEYKNNFSGFIEPNIGLLYVGGALKKAGYELEYIDFHLKDAEIRTKYDRPINMEDIKIFFDNFTIEDSTLVGISPLTINYNWATKIAKVVKSKNKSTKVVLGGVHVSFEYEKILKNEDAIDFIIVGEGEKSTVELADYLYSYSKNINDLKKIRGIAFKEDGKVCFTGMRDFISDLDSLAYPLYELYPKEYLTNSMIRVITSRGCSNLCSFCVPSNFFNKLRFRNYVNVVNEIEYYYKDHNHTLYMIGDLNFLNDYAYARKFCEEIIKRRLKIFWMCQSRVELIDREITKLMVKAGCIMICLGIESADQNILNASNKNINTEMSINACKIVKEAGINLFTFWVFGLPGETHESAHTTIKLLRKLLDIKLIDYTHCTVCVPYPGTQLFKNPEKFNIQILSNDYNKYWMGCDFLGSDLPVIKTEELSNFEIYAYWQMALAVVAGNLNK